MTKELTVTYRLYESEIDAVQELAAINGYTLEEQFQFMMTAGSKWDIERKINFWQKMNENESKKKEIALTSP